MTYTAVEAFAWLAVLAAELDQCLRRECVAASDEQIDDCVVLGRKRLEELDGAIGERSVIVGGAIGHLQGHYRVDDEACDRGCSE